MSTTDTLFLRLVRHGLITPIDRSRITRIVERDGFWRGVRRRITIELRLANHRTFNRVAWRARIDRAWYGGPVDTVYEALEAIEAQALSCWSRK